MIARAHYWLLRHRRVSRALTILAWLQLPAITAVATAPAAAAATNAAVLNWTGLHDTYGVPIGNFYLSLAGIQDQLTRTGPDAQAWEPSSWAPWLMHALKVLFTHLTAAGILTAEAGAFVGIFAVGLWVMRLSISTYFLTVCGEIAKAVTAAVITVTSRVGLVAITVPVGVFAGVLAIRRGEAGRGATMILLAITMPALAVGVFADPAGMMYGPDGLLAFGRRMGFSTAQAVTHNGAISGGGFTGQLDTLTSSLITRGVREPLEVFNFGHVVDRVGGCAQHYSAALLHGASDGPVKAMARCGDTAAVGYAQNLDGTNVFVGLVLISAAVLFGWFMISSGASVLMCSVKAIYTTAKLLPSVFAGGISGAAQDHARATVWRFFKHPLEAMVFIVFISVMGLAVDGLMSRPLPAELGGVSPFAHVLVMGGASAAALYLLRYIRADLQGRAPGRGVFSRAGDVALGLGLHAALGEAGSAALGGARGLRDLFDHRKTPWERLDERAGAKPEEVLGAPQDGFAPVPAGTDRPRAAGPGGRPGGDARQAIGAPDPAERGVDPLAGGVLGGERVRARGARPGGGVGPGTGSGEPGTWDEPAAGVQPISAGPAARHDRDAGAGPAAADIPLPPEPPPEGPDEFAPPEDDPGRATATVDPITGHERR